MLLHFLLDRYLIILFDVIACHLTNGVETTTKSKTPAPVPLPPMKPAHYLSSHSFHLDLNQGAPRDNPDLLLRYYLDRIEEHFGRRNVKCTVLESVRGLDAFQAALGNLSELRQAAENLFVLLLRGCPIKMLGKNVTEQVRACSYYTSVPRSLIARFPRYEALLANMKSLKLFHEAYPIAFHLDGTPVDPDKKGRACFCTRVA